MYFLCRLNPPPTPHGPDIGCIYTAKDLIISTSSFARFTRSAASPTFTYVSNPVLDSSLCRTAAPQLGPLQLLFAVCVRFSCCSRLRPFQLLPDGVHFVCCSPIASASTAAPRLCPLQLLLPASCSGRFQPCPLFSNILAEFEVQ